MLTRWQGWFGALAVTLVTLGLVMGEVDDAGFRRWWAGRPLTTDTVAGLLVLLITLLVVDQVVRLRQVRARAQATAAQAVIVLSEAERAARAVSAARSDAGGREAAIEQMRTYAIMLLVAAPVLIEAKLSRDFLEQAQQLAGEMARLLAAMAKRKPGAEAPSGDRMDEALERLRAVSVPVLQPLPHQELVAAGAEEW